MVRKSHEIHCREDFPLLLNWRRLYGPVVEIGVDRGWFSSIILTRWYGHEFYGVDCYSKWTERGEDANRIVDQVIAGLRYERFSNRAQLLGMSSERVARMFTDRGLRPDFVYLDAEHDLDSVSRNIAEWWPLVSNSGILAGHDYDETHSGVIQAVDRFAHSHPDLDIWLTHEILPSWYIYKGGTPGPDWKRLPLD
jgi:hypothetical protein